MSVVADGGPDDGLGHLARSTAVAQALAELGIATQLLAYGAAAPTAVDGATWTVAGPAIRGRVVVIDSYHLDAVARVAAAGDGALVEFADAEGTATPGAALVINPAAAPGTSGRELHGPQYACLRRGFWPGATPTAPWKQGGVRTVIVSVGAGDGGGLSARLAREVRDILPNARVRLVVGPAADSPADIGGVDVLRSPPDMAALLGSCDLVVCAAGQTMLEALALGRPCVATPVAANQLPQFRRMVAVGAVEADAAATAGVVSAADATIAASLLRLTDDARRRRLGLRARAIVDGSGAHRVARRICALIPRDG